MHPLPRAPGLSSKSKFFSLFCSSWRNTLQGQDPDEQLLQISRPSSWTTSKTINETLCPVASVGGGGGGGGGSGCPEQDHQYKKKTPEHAFKFKEAVRPHLPS